MKVAKRYMFDAIMSLVFAQRIDAANALFDDAPGNERVSVRREHRPRARPARWLGPQETRLRRASAGAGAAWRRS